MGTCENVFFFPFLSLSPYRHKVLIVCPYGIRFARQKVHRGDEMAGRLDKQMSSLLGLMKRLHCFCLFLPHDRNKEGSCRPLKCQLSVTRVNPSARHGKKNLIWSSAPAWVTSVVIVSRQPRQEARRVLTKKLSCCHALHQGGKL